MYITTDEDFLHLQQRLILCLSNLFSGTNFDLVAGKIGGTVEESAFTHAAKLNENEVFESILRHLAIYHLVQSTTEKLDKNLSLKHKKTETPNNSPTKQLTKKATSSIKTKLQTTKGRLEAITSFVPNFSNYIKE
jgi:hypothetical protein